MVGVPDTVGSFVRGFPLTKIGVEPAGPQQFTGPLVEGFGVVSAEIQVVYQTGAAIVMAGKVAR